MRRISKSAKCAAKVLKHLEILCLTPKNRKAVVQPPLLGQRFFSQKGYKLRYVEQAEPYTKNSDGLWNLHLFGADFGNHALL